MNFPGEKENTKQKHGKISTFRLRKRKQTTGDMGFYVSINKSLDKLMFLTNKQEVNFFAELSTRKHRKIQSHGDADIES